MKRVEYDINKSEYYFKVNKLTFFFSSKFNKTRFENGFIDYVNEETNKIKAKYVNWYNKKGNLCSQHRLPKTHKYNFLKYLLFVYFIPIIYYNQ